MEENETRESNGNSGEGRASGDDGTGASIWMLVDRSARQEAFEDVADGLRDRGMDVEVVTITEVIGSVAREALAGGAERILRGLRVAVAGRSGEEDFLGAVRRARPDLVVVTSGTYARPLSLLESVTGVTTTQIGVFPDFNYTSSWLNGSLQGFVVPHGAFARHLRDAGCGDDRLLEAGPPLLPGFERTLDRDEERSQLGLGEETVILVRSDTFDAASIDRLVFQATLVEDDVRFLFHHNGDGGAASALRRAADQYGLPASMFGRVSDLERYIAASDVVVAHPRDAFIPEIVAQRRPLMLVGPDDGVTQQVDLLLDAYGAGYTAEVFRLGSEMERFIETLPEAEEAAAEAAFHPGNEGVVDAIADALDRVEAWREEPTDVGGGGAEAPEAGGQDAGEGDERPAGPFEQIGQGTPESGRDTARTRPKEKGGAADRGAAPRGGISRAEAKEQLAELILMERELERRLSELERQQERWRNRLDLAREWQDDELAREAEDILRDYLDEAEEARDELSDIRRQKDKLKRAAGATGTTSRSRETRQRQLPGSDNDEGGRDREERLEDRFSEMEIDRDLDDLRRRIDDELGEE